MKQVEFNNKNHNPFYGMSNTLEIYQSGSKGSPVSRVKIAAAFDECENISQLAVLFSVLFYIGDVTNRQHNLFDGKVDGGGNAQREVFRDNIIPFLVSKTKKMKKAKRLELINLIVEYTTMDNIVATRVKTKKKSTTVVDVINMVEVFGVEDVSSYIANIILKGSPFQKTLVAKFVTRPRFSKRSGNTKMLPETEKVHKTRAQLIEAISNKTKLPYEDKVSYIGFTGFYHWKKQYNRGLESVLFSTGNVKDMDQEQFIELIDRMPSDARFRVRNRVMFDEEGKWGKLKDWYLKWESYKEQKQAEQRKLEDKVAQGTASTEDKVNLQTVKKQANVNVGANSFTSMFTDIIKGEVDQVKIQPFLDKVNLPYNSLVFMDDSGSMSFSWSGTPYVPAQFASFIATVVLMKNPDTEARNLLGMFSGNTRLYNGINSQTERSNSIMRGTTRSISKVPLIDPKKTFMENFTNMSKALRGACVNGMTNISSIPEGVHRWSQGDPQKLEELMRYPVWTLISDGEFNNMPSPEASMNDFMRKCEKYFGFKPFLILIDVSTRASNKITRFSGIDSVMMVPPNPASIEMLLTNFKDMDTYDVYTPLLSLSRTNRYAPIRKFVESM